MLKGQHLVLGKFLDEPPGAVFDKVAREMRIAERKGQFRLNCGSDVEELAKVGNRLIQNCDCFFILIKMVIKINAYC